MKHYAFLLALLIGISFLTSCEKDPVAPGGDEVAPQLPPQESFIMPFTGFEDADTTGFKTNKSPEDKSGPTSYRNWFVAASSVAIWNTVVGLTTGVPVASFKEAFNHQATYAGEGVFVWAYDFKVAGKTYIASLSGQFINNNQEIKWEMKVSQLGGFNEVTWYTGIVSEDLTKASWTLNHQPENPQPFISIDYELDKTTNAFTLRYTNIIPGNADKGAYIEYRTRPGETYNRAYDVFQVKENNFLEILWDVPSYEGRVKNPNFFKDEEWHCWNGDQMDTDC